MNPQKLPTKPCPTCTTGVVLNHEINRKHNATDESGRQVCPACKVKEMIANFRSNNVPTE